MEEDIQQFREIVWDYYARNSRHFPWREPVQDEYYDPYRILVSEIMLQQTQAPRVVAKFIAFTERFPTFKALAEADLAEVLQEWVGLGYNRRAKFLWQSAKIVSNDWQDLIPKDPQELVALPGIGMNTACAIVAYAYNAPVVFIETNIRTVYIHHFFASADRIADTDLVPIIEASLDHENPREWYWALMDYGTHLKSTMGNASRRSRHHVTQSAFKGSIRQIRGKVIKHLASGQASFEELQEVVKDDRLQVVLDALVSEELIKLHKSSNYTL